MPPSMTVSLFRKSEVSIRKLNAQDCSSRHVRVEATLRDGLQCFCEFVSEHIISLISRYHQTPHPTVISWFCCSFGGILMVLGAYYLI